MNNFSIHEKCLKLPRYVRRQFFPLSFTFESQIVTGTCDGQKLGLRGNYL